jgi:hypothetical protein
MKNDSILPVTRLVSVIVIPFLWVAFFILFFFPDQTGERFAWLIKPHMTSLFIGSGYLGGSWLFINALFGKRWHRIQGGFLAITAFTWFMLFATFLHWDRFSHGTLGFTAWFVLYLITPFLVPALWMYNRRTDDGQPEESDLVNPSAVRWLTRLFGTVVLVAALTGFLLPDFFIRIWPWTLTPLTARVMSGWVALLGVGAFSMAADSRWSAWRAPMESILIWHGLVLVAMGMTAPDFTTGLLNWYTLFIVMMVLALVGYYLWMEMRRRKAVASPSGASA